MRTLQYKISFSCKVKGCSNNMFTFRVKRKIKRHILGFKKGNKFELFEENTVK